MAVGKTFSGELSILVSINEWELKLKVIFFMKYELHTWAISGKLFQERSRTLRSTDATWGLSPNWTSRRNRLPIYCMLLLVPKHSENLREADHDNRIGVTYTILPLLSLLSPQYFKVAIRREGSVEIGPKKNYRTTKKKSHACPEFCIMNGLFFFAGKQILNVVSAI